MKIVTPILIMLICVGMYFLYISPAYSNIGVLQAKKTEYDTVLLQSQQLIKQRDAILTQYNSIPQDDIDKLGKIIPSKFDSVVFLNNLSSIATRDGVTVKDVKVNQTNPNSRDTTASAPTNAAYATADVVLTLTGAYPQFLQFLRDVESSLELIDVQTLTITPTTVTQTTGSGTTVQKVTSTTMEYQLDLNTYSLK